VKVCRNFICELSSPLAVPFNLVKRALYFLSCGECNENEMKRNRFLQDFQNRNFQKLLSEP